MDNKLKKLIRAYSKCQTIRKNTISDYNLTKRKYNGMVEEYKLTFKNYKDTIGETDTFDKLIKQ